jgi:hypothetical protein
MEAGKLGDVEYPTMYRPWLLAAGDVVSIHRMGGNPSGSSYQGPSVPNIVTDVDVLALDPKK